MELFDFFNYSFFNRALIMSVLTGISCGIIGTWVLLLNISFVGITIAHCAFAGAVMGIFLGINPILLGFISCILYSLIIEPISKKAQIHNNTSMSILFSFSIGIAFLFIGLLKDKTNTVFTFLFGNILMTTNMDICFNSIILIFILVFTVIFNKVIIAILFSREISKSSAIPENLVYHLILVLICATISINIKAVGGLLIYSLVSLPAITAYQLTNNLKNIYILSSVFAVLSCIIGLFISSVISIPTSATIILVSCILFFISLFFSKRRSYL